MNFEDLLQNKKIKNVEKEEPDFRLSERDIKVAKNSFENGSYDWAYSIAYNAALQAGMTLMFALGFRPSGAEQHKTTFEFLKKTGFDSVLTDYFNKVRMRRNSAVYRDADTITKEDAEEVINKAESFVHKIRTVVLKK